VSELRPIPQFPNYQPPNPKGIPVADPKFGKPLYKLMKVMLKPRTQTVRMTHRTKPREKKVKYW